MLRQSFTSILLLSVISSVYSQQSPADTFNGMCDKSMKAIKAGTFEKVIKEMQECREKAIPKDLLVGLNKCADILPMLTAEQVTKVCSDKDANLAKLIEQYKCKEKAFDKKYTYISSHVECSPIKGF